MLDGLDAMTAGGDLGFSDVVSQHLMPPGRSVQETDQGI